MLIKHQHEGKCNHRGVTETLDKFSKLGQAFYITTKSAIEICNSLIKYFSFYGIPEQITCDNGTKFNNDTVKELLKLHKINIHFTTPLHHESNSPVERFNYTLLEHLQILNNQHKEDPTLMEYAIVAYNNSIHSSTKYTPLQLTFGHTSTRDPYDLIETTFYTDYIENHRNKVKIIYNSVAERQNQLKTNLTEKRNKNGPDQYQFKVGQKVFKVNEKRNKKENKFNGPFEIIEILQNNKVKVKHKHNKTETIHVKELRISVSVADSPSP